MPSTSIKPKLARRPEEASVVESAISAVSHDLGARLLAIEGFAQILSEGDFDAEQRSICDRIGANASIARRQLTGAVRFLRVAEARLVPSPIDMGIAVAQAAARLNEETKEARFDPERDLHVGPQSPARADPALTALLLDQLLDNTLKFASGEPLRLEFCCHEGVEFNTYALRDNGIGLDFDASDRAFELFRSLHDDTRAGAVAGAGVGLAIARLIVGRHGGSIWCEPAPGGGSVFAFTLPAVKRATNQTVREDVSPRP